ncbi:hypothetical protein PESP_a2501 [Pseudoalteromonas espejiana DSM 9414]|uniref:Uncharacterized protein n=1 Tax=Pseudoalteromonas espejiana TaxID=28107 RepID=A0A510XWR4_9GAMM|nr:hypothetical protein [Pseudoalteromonas espejiana]ASM50462.1 hypothetical protein PESP_a2501 [Pseudoalteromonas espejiana DSM 9414]GEK55438.1 hypothetical protein PES01_22830 [Pseudoalteromonas espejiana]
MKNNDFLDVYPTYESDIDKAYRAGHAVSSLIPTGAAIYESIVTNPTQKRTKLWMEQVISKLAELDESNKIDIKELSNRPEFSATFLKVLQEVEISSQREKLTFLANFVVNTALDSDIGEDLLFIMTDCLKTITPSHIQALKLYTHPVCFDERFVQIHNYTCMGQSGGFTHLKTNSAPEELAKIFYTDKSINVMATNINLEETQLFWQLIHKNISLLNFVELKEQIHKTKIPSYKGYGEKTFKVTLNCSPTSLGKKLLKLITP